MDLGTRGFRSREFRQSSLKLNGFQELRNTFTCESRNGDELDVTTIIFDDDVTFAKSFFDGLSVAATINLVAGDDERNFGIFCKFLHFERLRLNTISD